MKKENIVIFYLLSFTWGILWTLLGLLVLPIVLLIFNKKVELLTRQKRLVVYIKDAGFGGGISLGIYSIVGSKSERLIRHEIGHTIQNAWFGPLFIFIVGIPSMIRYRYRKIIKKRNPEKVLPDYDSIWFEGQATKLGNRYQ